MDTILIVISNSDKVGVVVAARANRITASATDNGEGVPEPSCLSSTVNSNDDLAAAQVCITETQLTYYLINLRNVAQKAEGVNHNRNSHAQQQLTQSMSRDDVSNP